MQTQPIPGMFVEVLGRFFFLGERYRCLVLIININFRNAATCHLKFIDFIKLASTYQCGRKLCFGEPITTRASTEGMVVLRFLQCNKSGYQIVSHVI